MGEVRFEQAVYGSFPFRTDGYAMLAQSSGCRPQWLSDFRAACQRMGERPTGASSAPVMFALRLASGPWVVVGMTAQGDDDRGRPGATAFHGIVLTPRDYRAAGASPFAFARLLRSDWSADTTLSAGVWNAPTEVVETSERSRRIAVALANGRRVVVESPEPIDGLAREVWSTLPRRVRSRISVATWAFGKGNRFDLLAVPRLAGLVLDDTYLVDPPDMHTRAAGEPATTRRPRHCGLALGAAAVLVGGLGVGFALRGQAEREGRPSRFEAPRVRATAPNVAPDPPDRAAYRDDPTERPGAIEAIAELADRFGVRGETVPDPVVLMETFARNLRYSGPMLTARERSALERAPGREAVPALARDSLISHFVADRPLPEDFREGPLRWQFAALAWSFHQRDDPRRSPAEVAHALGEVLAVDVPVRPLDLEDRYPALAAYREFLARLPRR